MCSSDLVEPTENDSQPIGVLPLNPSRAAGGKESPQAFVPEALDRHTGIVTVVVTGRKNFPSPQNVHWSGLAPSGAAICVSAAGYALPPLPRSV